MAASTASTTASERPGRQLRVVHAHLLAGAEWRLHDPQRPLTHDRLLYVIQRPFGRITSMPATGHNRTQCLVLQSGRSRSLQESRASYFGWRLAADSYQYRHPTPFPRWLSTAAFDRLLQQRPAGVDTSNVSQWAPDAAHAAYA